MKYTFLSWNVNGIRAAVRKGFTDFLKTKKPDILGLQEVKIDDTTRNKEKFDFVNYEEYWNSAKRPGYAGTMTLLKEKSNLQKRFAKHSTGIGIKKFDDEGRVQTLEFDKFYFVNTYFPHTRHDLSRLDFKLEFNKKLLGYIKKLDKNKPIIWTGDFNVAHQEIDLFHPKQNEKNPGFLPEERDWADNFIKAGFIDTFRTLHPKKEKYSWWSFRARARERNVGWRIDYFFVSKRIKNKVKKAFIWDQVFGSDHCPVGVEVEI
ncbi:MAG: exodeoxyribonuclease III [Candidatus Magasanikbacteria bacterium]|nr:exodeoxyribonuclease III [Candidatus Magasanikbacteria bacterium]